MEKINDFYGYILEWFAEEDNSSVRQILEDIMDNINRLKYECR